MILCTDIYFLKMNLSVSYILFIFWHIPILLNPPPPPPTPCYISYEISNSDTNVLCFCHFSPHSHYQNRCCHIITTLANSTIHFQVLWCPAEDVVVLHLGMSIEYGHPDTRCVVPLPRLCQVLRARDHLQGAVFRWASCLIHRILPLHIHIMLFCGLIDMVVCWILSPSAILNSMQKQQDLPSYPLL